MKKAIFAICITGLSAALAITTEPIDGGGTALIVDAAAFDSDEKTALNNNTVTELWKTGDSTLVAEGIASFTGVIRVKSGIYKPSAASGMGASSCVIYVTQGGCLYTTVTANRTVHVSGTGYGDYPAIVKNATTLTLVMDDDATMGFTGNWCSVGSINMQGHTLTTKYTPGVSRSEGVWPSASNVSNPGHIIIDAKDPGGTNKGRLTFLYVSDQLQGSEHTITIRNGGLDWYRSDKKTNWKLIVESGVTATIGYNGTDGDLTAGKSFKWGGPIELAEGATLSLAPGRNIPVIVDGDISGAGKVSKTGSSTLYSAAYLKGRNTYTGGTTVSMGTLVLHSLDSVASLDPSKWTITGDTAIAICLNGGAIVDGFSGEDAADVLNAFKSWGSSRPVRFAVTNGAVANLTFNKSSTSETVAYGTYTNAAFGFLGSAHVNSTFANKAPFTTYGNGVCEVSATSETMQDVGDIRVYSGTTVLKNFGHVHDHTNAIYVTAFSPSSERCSRLVLDEGTFIDQGWASNGPMMQIGYNGTHGIVEIREGAAITNHLNYVGNSTGGYGAIYQSGGFACWGRPSGSYDGYFAQNYGHAYINVFGGRMETKMHTHFSDTLSSTMLLEISDNGNFTAGGAEFHIGWGGTSVVYQTGGVLDTAASSSVYLRINSSHYTKYCTRGFGSLMVADTGVARVSSLGVIMNERTNGMAHVALVDGGTLETKILKRAIERGAKNGDNTEVKMPFPELCDGGKAFPSFVHFNGGVLRARAAGDILGVRTETADTRPTDVIVYSKGAILDSSNFTVTVNTPLTAPGGNGVASVELPTGTVRTGYRGAPVVSIYGDGEGALAAAIFDKETGTISGIRVLAPGRNYTTATARLAGGGKASITNILACTFAPNTSGGLAKRGTGTLVLNAANSYGGRTVLEGGVLKLGVAGALPSGSEIELAGGALDVNGQTAPTQWHLDFAKVVESGAPIACPGDLAFPAGSTLSVDNIDYDYLAAATSGFPLLTVTGTMTGSPALVGLNSNLWKLARHGKSLYMSSTRGTAIILR